ncbi:hypothetical protein I3760_01G304300 [Carya illinoinensis]|nr:hypothetical protein I3760_01G304300 [Carya illinoinensis]
MEDQRHSFFIPRSDSKIMGEKRSSAGVGDKDDSARGRVKMRDLESVCRSEGINTHYKKSLKNKESSDQFQFGEEEMSQVTEVPVTLDLDASQAEKTGRNSFPLAVNLAPRSLDLNTEVCVAEDSACGDGQKYAENSNPPSLHRKRERVHDGKCLTSRGIGFDLNAEDVSSSVSPETCYPSKIHGQLKSRDVSECESSLGPLEEKDPKRRWEEMKQNGFLSSSYGGIPMAKQRVKKSKNDMIKKRMELAKREQIDRFTKIAAPSGLLNELNPGIINHVRNRKQVHSIIEALVRSEQLENGNVGSKQTANQRSGTTESGNRMDPENINDSRIHPVTFSHEDGHLNTLSGIRQTGVYTMPMNKYSQSTVEGKCGRNELSMVERVCGKSHIPHFTPLSEDTTLELKVSSSSQASENASSSSNEDSANFASTVKAASVASQWLELLHQDIQGRLLALRRSRKRVRAVISTELPFLISKEFSSSQVNTPYVIKNSIDEFSNSATADMHRARWNTLFDQMDKALSEEEKQLESWLNQVKEMQLHCEQGLQHVNWNAAFGLKQLGTSENDSRLFVPSIVVHGQHIGIIVICASRKIKTTG